MSGLVESPARPSDAVVSPELALVDSALAELGRARPILPAPRPRARPHLTWSADDRERRTLVRSLEPLVARVLARVPVRLQRRPRPYLLAGATALVVASIAVSHLGGGGDGLGPVTESQAPVDVRAAAGPGSTASPPASGPGSTSGAARRFAWAPVKGADGYHVELYRGSERVFAGESRGPTISVPAKWTYAGKSRSLVPGEYRWYVWSVVSGARGSNAIVQANLVVSST